MVRQTIKQLEGTSGQDSSHGMFKQVAILAVDAHASLISKLNRLIDRADDPSQNRGWSIYRPAERRIRRSRLAADDTLLVIQRRLEDSERERSELLFREQTLLSQSEHRANEKE